MLAARLIHGSSARTATANGATQAVDNQHLAGRLAILYSVTAVSGTTPTVNHVLQWSTDNGTTWHTDLEYAPPQLTSAGTGALAVAIKGSSWRLNIVIGGTTPSVTSSVVAVIY